MVKICEREKAIGFRQQGYSIGDIAKILSVSKSTVSGWCRDVPLSNQAIQRISAKGKQKSVRGLLRYSEAIRQKRISETKKSEAEGKKRIGKLSKRDVFCIGLGLYWGEGYKRGSQEFGFTNSDPEMIKFYITWLDSVFKVAKKDLILRVSINSAHAKRIDKVEQYWSELTSIPLSQFTKTSLIKTANKKQYSNSEVHMGTLRIKVRGGTAMRREVIGAIRGIEL